MGTLHRLLIACALISVATAESADYDKEKHQWTYTFTFNKPQDAHGNLQKLTIKSENGGTEKTVLEDSKQTETSGDKQDVNDAYSIGYNCTPDYVNVEKCVFTIKLKNDKKIENEFMYTLEASWLKQDNTLTTTQKESFYTNVKMEDDPNLVLSGDGKSYTCTASGVPPPELSILYSTDGKAWGKANNPTNKNPTCENWKCVSTRVADVADGVQCIAKQKLEGKVSIMKKAIKFRETLKPEIKCLKEGDGNYTCKCESTGIPAPKLSILKLTNDAQNNITTGSCATNTNTKPCVEARGLHDTMIIACVGTQKIETVEETKTTLEFVPVSSSDKINNKPYSAANGWELSYIWRPITNITYQNFKAVEVYVKDAKTPNIIYKNGGSKEQTNEVDCCTLTFTCQEGDKTEEGNCILQVKIKDGKEGVENDYTFKSKWLAKYKNENKIFEYPTQTFYTNVPTEKVEIKNVTNKDDKKVHKETVTCTADGIPAPELSLKYKNGTKILDKSPAKWNKERKLYEISTELVVKENVTVVCYASQQLRSEPYTVQLHEELHISSAGKYGISAVLLSCALFVSLATSVIKF